MASSESRNTRKKRRVKRNLSQARRALREQTNARVQAHATLLMVLSQLGGEITISQGTMQTVLQGMQMLNWVTEAKIDETGAAVPNEFIVRVVTQEGVQAVVDEAIAASVVPQDTDSSIDDLSGTLTPNQAAAIQQQLDALDAALDAPGV